MECKEVEETERSETEGDLIDTLWNVKKGEDEMMNMETLDLIDTLWNVKLNQE